MLLRLSGFVFSAILLFQITASCASAQSFFVNLGTDPATGVDRGSAARISPVDRPTGFLTLSSDGAASIGPWIGSVSHARPGLLAAGDQLDLVAVIGGPSADDGVELLAGGLGYRLRLGETGLTVFANADRSDFVLGRAPELALDIDGAVTNAAAGIRKLWQLGRAETLTGTVELAARHDLVRLSGSRVTDEQLRVLRVAAVHEQGVPYGLRRRLAASASKGLDGLGASPGPNPLASAPGVSPDFLRVAGSGEISVPLPSAFVVNAGIIGQWSGDSLPVSQRCGYGTNSYARGFDRSYVNGDSCFGGRVELAYDLERPTPGAPMFRATQAFVGLDGGRVRDNANAVLPAATDGWSSVSTGIRALWGEFLGELAVTHILDQPAGAFEQDRTRFWVRSALRF